MLTIRPLIPSDAEQYWRLRLEALDREPWAFASSANEFRQTTPESIAQTHLADKGDGSFMLGAFAGNELVGMAGCIRERHEKRFHRAFVVAVYLTASHRGVGMGRKMMEELIVRARKIEGLEALNLGVIADDSPAHRLYQALGFRTYGLERRAMVIDGHGIDEELMQLIL